MKSGYNINDSNINAEYDGILFTKLCPHCGSRVSFYIDKQPDNMYCVYCGECIVSKLECENPRLYDAFIKAGLPSRFAKELSELNMGSTLKVEAHMLNEEQITLIGKSGYNVEFRSIIANGVFINQKEKYFLITRVC